MASASPGLPRARHRVAIERGHERRFVARDVEQNRRDAAAVHGAVVDAGEQDERGRGPQAQAEDHGNQNGHAVGWAEAGQGADQGAQKAADQGQQQVLPGEGNGKAIGQELKESMVMSLLLGVRSPRGLWPG